jgi:uncharacterized protein
LQGKADSQEEKMRIKKIVFVMLALLMVGMLTAKDKNFMWKVEEGNTKVYLLGSVHLMKPEIYPLSPVIDKAFEESDVLVVEVDASKMDPAEIQKIVMEQGLYTDDTTLESVLPKEYYDKLAKELADSGMATIDAVNKFKPWYVSINLGAMRVMKMGMDPALGIDMNFLNKAKGKKDILELETADFQLQILSSMDEDLQIELIKESLDDPDETVEMVDKLVDAWQTGNTKAMDKLMNKKLRERPELQGFYKALFTDRNIKMTDKIEGFLQSNDGKTYFVIIGSGHYVGKEGIIKLLKKKGHKAKQL